MKFINFSRAEASDNQCMAPYLSRDNIWISIVDPKGEPVNLKTSRQTRDILRLEFHDVCDSYPKSKNIVYFSDEHAQLIYDFVNKNSDVDHCLIHCEYGQSRSPAIANALSQWMNSQDADIRNKDECVHNSYIYELLLEHTQS